MIRELEALYDKTEQENKERLELIYKQQEKVKELEPELRKGVTATFWLRGLKLLLIHMLDDFKRRLKPAATGFHP